MEKKNKNKKQIKQASFGTFKTSILKLRYIEKNVLGLFSITHKFLQ